MRCTTAWTKNPNQVPTPPRTASIRKSSSQIHVMQHGDEAMPLLAGISSHEQGADEGKDKNYDWDG